MDYRLEPNSSEEEDAPPDKLTLAFATAEVVVLGWKLTSLAEHLRDGDLLSVGAMPSRYAGLDRFKTFVAAITIAPVAKDAVSG